MVANGGGHSCPRALLLPSDRFQTLVTFAPGILHEGADVPTSFQSIGEGDESPDVFQPVLDYVEAIPQVDSNHRCKMERVIKYIVRDQLSAIVAAEEAQDELRTVIAAHNAEAELLNREEKQTSSGVPEGTDTAEEIEELMRAIEDRDALIADRHNDQMFRNDMRTLHLLGLIDYRESSESDYDELKAQSLAASIMAYAARANIRGNTGRPPQSIPEWESGRVIDFEVATNRGLEVEIDRNDHLSYREVGFGVSEADKQADSKGHIWHSGIWFRFETARDALSYVIDVSGTGPCLGRYDPEIYLYDGIDGGLLDSDDDSGAGADGVLDARLVMHDLRPEHPYYLFVRQPFGLTLTDQGHPRKFSVRVVPRGIVLPALLDRGEFGHVDSCADVLDDEIKLDAELGYRNGALPVKQAVALPCHDSLDPLARRFAWISFEATAGLHRILVGGHERVPDIRLYAHETLKNWADENDWVTAVDLPKALATSDNFGYSSGAEVEKDLESGLYWLSVEELNGQGGIAFLTIINNDAVLIGDADGLVLDGGAQAFPVAGGSELRVPILTINNDDVPPGLYRVDAIGQGAVDPVLALYNADNQELLASDDDSGPGSSARIITSLREGKYELGLAEYDDGYAGTLLASFSKIAVADFDTDQDGFAEFRTFPIFTTAELETPGYYMLEVVSEALTDVALYNEDWSPAANSAWLTEFDRYIFYAANQGPLNLSVDSYDTDFSTSTHATDLRLTLLREHVDVLEIGLSDSKPVALSVPAGAVHSLVRTNVSQRGMYEVVIEPDEGAFADLVMFDPTIEQPLYFDTLDYTESGGAVVTVWLEEGAYDLVAYSFPNEAGERATRFELTVRPAPE